MHRALPLVALLGLGCVPPKPGPAEAYRSFVEAVAKRDANGAWSRLSKDSQALLTDAARKVAEAERRTPPTDGRALLVSEATYRPALKQTDAVFEGSEVARVNVLDEAGGRGTVRFVQEDAQWKLDVSEELRRASSR